MRFAWLNKIGMIAAAALMAASARGQINPHTNIVWPANCNTGGGMVYNVLLNQCLSVGINWRGAWDPAATYAVNDAVLFLGSGYIATAISTGVAPPASPWASFIQSTFNGGTVTTPIIAPGFTGPLTGHASLDLPLTGGILTGPLNGTTIAVSGAASVGLGTYTTTFAPQHTQVFSWTLDTSSPANFLASIGGETSINSVPVLLFNLSNTTPAAPPGSSNVAWNCVGSNCAGSVVVPQASIIPAGGQPLSTMICAVGSDTTIGNLTITNVVSAGGSSWTLTVSTGPTNAQYLLGETFQGANITPSSLNGRYTITALSSTTITATALDGQSGSYTSGGNTYKVCTNSADATTVATQAFDTTLVIPAPSVYPVGYTVAMITQTWTAASGVPSFSLPLMLWNGSNLSAWSGNGTLRASCAGCQNGESFTVYMPYSGLLLASPDRQSLGLASPTGSITNNGLTTSSGGTLTFKTGFNASGVASGTYTSGGSITGSAAQTCTLTAFNNSSTATATVALTGTNTIAGGTALVITSRGASATAAPTTATLGNGTATCSGTATLATVLGGSPGNAVRLLTLRATPIQ